MKIIIILLSLFLLNGNNAAANVLFYDASGVDPVNVHKIIQVKNVKDILKAIEEAKTSGSRISISGARHAQGGQQSYPNGIVLDMLKFNRIISLDTKHKIISVQSGATWEKIQKYITPYGYALKVIQDDHNYFTVGGALGSNIHGNDPNYGAIIETVRSFHLILADGRLINVSRQENPELFKLAIGGYGLFGVIVDVDFLLTDNVMYKQSSVEMDYKEYPKFFKARILGNDNVGLCHTVFLNVGNKPLKNVQVAFYIKVKKDDGLQKKYKSRNTMMSKPKPRKSLFGTVKSNKINSHVHNWSFLQEYFVPVDKFVSFIDRISGIIQQEPQKPYMYTRYVPKDNGSFLPYAKVDSFGVGIEWHHNLSVHDIKIICSLTSQITDVALNSGGTYYLTKQLYLLPSREQLLRAYPEFDDFIKMKKKYDPHEMFMNQFYDKYK